MELAGAALGAVSVVGVLGQIFDGCIKAYAIFTTASNLSRDTERLVCKMRIEEMRLMVWGREWGVAEGKLEAHLAMTSTTKGDNERMKEMAEMILKQLLDTIGNSKKMKERYGIKEGNGSDDKSARKPTEPSRSADLRLRARWVIADKDKFGVLLQDLKDYNDGLERLFPASRIATIQRAWTNELLQTAKRDVEQLNLLETASDGTYPQLTNSANLKQLRINLDATEEGSTKFKPTSELKIQPHQLSLTTDNTAKRTRGEYRKIIGEDPQHVILEWVPYDKDAEMEQRLLLCQRVDNLARMVHSASNRHPDLHTLDCIGYFDDKASSRYGLAYRIPPSPSSATPPAPLSLSYLITDAQQRTPDLDDRFKLAHTLAVALWSFHSLDWLHKAFCSTNILFFPESPTTSLPLHTKDTIDTPANGNPPNRTPSPSKPTSSTSTPPQAAATSFQPTPLTHPYLTGYSTSRPTSLTEMTSPPPTSTYGGADLYRHPSSLGLWRQPYRKAFDIYSLGLVLLEIGLWKSMREFYRPRHGVEGFLEKVVRPVLVGRLGGRCGRRFQGVVERCLAAGGKEGDEGDEEAGRLMEWVVGTLEGLRV
ncbi:MAG: hypothetical protein M1817_006830 [Caeruleum heppii]|nr:MAG: hypothetical protein M1817_006830 [Caeruleum heppii]